MHALPASPQGRPILRDKLLFVSSRYIHAGRLQEMHFFEVDLKTGYGCGSDA